MDANHLRFNQSDGSVSLIVQAGFLVKNQLPSISPVPIIIPSLARTCKREQLDRLLCPIRALKFYLKMTSSYYQRQLRYLESFGFKMGIYTIKLAYRKLINRDISFLKIKAHEVRALSSSWAFFDKVPLDEILKVAVRNHSSMFAKFYLRDTSSKSPEVRPNSFCTKSGGGPARQCL